MPPGRGQSRPRSRGTPEPESDSPTPRIGALVNDHKRFPHRVSPVGIGDCHGADLPGPVCGQGEVVAQVT